MTLPIFPNIPGMEWHNKKTQKWNTIVKKSGSRKRKTMTTWAYPEWTLEQSFTAMNKSQIEQLAGFLGKVRGQLVPFLWRDMEDYKETNVRIGTGNGINIEFQLLRNFDNVYVEPVKDIVAGTLTVYVDDVLVPHTLGIDGLVIITAPASGAIVAASFEYYWRVAFEDDYLDWTIFWYDVYKTSSFKLVSV